MRMALISEELAQTRAGLRPESAEVHSRFWSWPKPMWGHSWVGLVFFTLF